MEPIPETVEALRELTRFGDETIARTLLEVSRDVERVVPEVVGISLSLVADDLTFTMTATTGPVAELDSMQYLAGGPCDETLRTGVPHAFRGDDVVDEDRWQVFAQATAVAGIESTLSLPILHHGDVIAGVNIYASTSDAFDGAEEAVARACGAWAGGAVKNADLGFMTRARAAQAPDRLRSETLVHQAAGTLMSRWGVSLEKAEDRLRHAAHRAGISEAQLARAILVLLVESYDDDVQDDRG